MFSTPTRTTLRSAASLRVANNLGMRRYTSKAAGGRVFEITAETFDHDVLESKVPTIVDFYASWCQPCKILGPILAKAVEKDGRLNLAKINVDENLDLARDYQITSLPTVMAFRNGEPIGAFIGMRPPAAIDQFIKETVEN
ncbi:hypothetical protein LPJ64_005332 [Coemansia asiatica]|uniref:Thioredoxin domain-containing protein n=1 Tax=Coemansia asiatica TaxID=1052880 RepID=A0A9W7XEL9_9FUNG|nr:hypothetical protein LPJ64_005332 [Coemansia asiatica]KAJ2882338.1 hypothetical protein FB639_002414 [Coemansia asiatica]